MICHGPKRVTLMSKMQPPSEKASDHSQPKHVLHQAPVHRALLKGCCNCKGQPGGTPACWPCLLSLLNPDGCGHADDIYRKGDEEDDYCSTPFTNVLWRTFDFRPCDHYTAEEVTEMGPGPDYETGDIAIKHLHPAQIAWVDMMVSPISQCSHDFKHGMLPFYKVMKMTLCFKECCIWQVYISK